MNQICNPKALNDPNLPFRATKEEQAAILHAATLIRRVAHPLTEEQKQHRAEVSRMNGAKGGVKPSAERLALAQKVYDAAMFTLDPDIHAWLVAAFQRLASNEQYDRLWNPAWGPKLTSRERRRLRALSTIAIWRIMKRVDTLHVRHLAAQAAPAIHG